MIQFRLPWPSARLSPNARLHWAQKAKAVKAARKEARLSVLHQVYAADRAKTAGQRLRVSLEFIPKTAARRDLDNLIASCKGALDGIADALAVDDSRFELSARIGPKCPEGAYVSVTVESVNQTTTESKP